MFLQIEAMKFIKRDFLFWPLGHAPGVKLGTPGGPEGQKNFEHGHVTRSIKEALQKVLKNLPSHFGAM